MSAMKIGDENRRQEAITVLLTKREKEMVIKAALARGIPPSVMVRQAALNVVRCSEVSAA